MPVTSTTKLLRQLFLIHSDVDVQHACHTLRNHGARAYRFFLGKHFFTRRPKGAYRAT